jgi:ketosteroid isomerase-like protein
VSTTENKEIVVKVMAAVGSRDIRTLAEMATEDLAYTVMGTVTIGGERDKAGCVEVASGLAGMLDGDFAYENVVLTAEDNRVAAAFDGRERLIDGRRDENVYHVLLLLRGGKVCELRELFDTEYANELLGPLVAPPRAMRAESETPNGERAQTCPSMPSTLGGVHPEKTGDDR